MSQNPFQSNMSPIPANGLKNWGRYKPGKLINIAMSYRTNNSKYLTLLRTYQIFARVVEHKDHTIVLYFSLCLQSKAWFRVACNFPYTYVVKELMGKYKFQILQTGWCSPILNPNCALCMPVGWSCMLIGCSNFLFCPLLFECPPSQNEYFQSYKCNSYNS